MLGFLKKKKAAAPEVTITWEETLHPAMKDLPVEEDDDYGNSLPFGWLYKNKDFVDKITNEYHHFFDCYIDARKGGDPVVIFGMLKSLVIYMEEAREVCQKKGENHLLWFDEYLTSQGQLERYKTELADIEENIDDKMHEFEERLQREAFEASLTDEFVLESIMMCEPATHGQGVLQKDFCKMFPYPKSVSSKLYYMEKEGKIERIKSGNSYILKIK